MDKELLFQFMRTRFREAGFSEQEIKLHISRFSDRYQNRSDDEIETDINKHGGPSKVVARVIEQRNTVLMNDPEYRAFAENAQENAMADSEAAPKPTKKADAPTASAAQMVKPQPPAPAADEDDDVIRYTPKQQISAAAPKQNAPVQQPVPVQHPAPQTAAAPAQTEQPKTASPVSQQDELLGWFGGAQQGNPLPGSHTQAQPVSMTAQPIRTAQPRQPVQAGQPAPVQLGQSSHQGTTARGPVQSAPAGTVQPQADSSDLTRTWSVPPQAGTAPHTVQNPPEHVTDPGRTRSAGQSASGHPAARRSDGSASGHNNVRRNPAAKPKEKAKEPKKDISTRLAEITYWGEGTEEGFRRFWILFAVSLPFVILLLLAFALLSAGIIVGIIAGIIACIILLVGEVALGAAISLVGVIYGISQLFLTMPIGLFELGIGICAIGITMFAGILIYNIAVRLLPFLLKQFIRFLKFFRSFLVDLYYYVKGECYRR
ncbi:MAG: hypothetical protein MJ175_06725 [Clostridia bacterium]|nr:hypothetical protein [Clostridia bacterium]